jgi:hypothetical protein
LESISYFVHGEGEEEYNVDSIMMVRVADPKTGFCPRSMIFCLNPDPGPDPNQGFMIKIAKLKEIEKFFVGKILYFFLRPLRENIKHLET